LHGILNAKAIQKTKTQYMKKTTIAHGENQHKTKTMEILSHAAGYFYDELSTGGN
jgi:uncharacterized protein YbgA (DUF1722 family)